MASKHQLNRPKFKKGIHVLLLFLAATTLKSILAVETRSWLLGPDPTALTYTIFTAGSYLVTLLLILAVLRYEDVKLAEIGLTRNHAVLGVAAIAGLWIAGNALATMIVVATGRYNSIGLMYDDPPGALILAFALQWVFVGFVEEIEYRGYVQNRLIQLVPGSSRMTAAVGVLTTAFVFAGVHIPHRILVGGMGVTEIVSSLSTVFAFGLLVGIVYAATRNLVFVALFHGTGNRWPLFVDITAWPLQLLIVWLIGGLMLLAATVLLYRRWGIPRLNTTRQPPTSRKSQARS